MLTVSASSAVVAALQDTPGRIILYYSFDPTDAENTKTRAFIYSLIRQILPACDTVSKYLREQYHESLATSSLPDTGKLLGALVGIMMSLAKHSFYIIIDGVDDSIDFPFIMELFQNIIEFGDGYFELHLLFTSRHNFQIDNSENSMVFFSQHRVRPSEQKENTDIEDYIKAKLQTDRRLTDWPSEMKEEVLQKLSQGAHGM